MDGKSLIIVVMPIKGGKGLIFILLASVKDTRTIVVVMLLIVLK
jgi:hypothetical protein